MAFRKLSGNFLALCLVCFVATSVLQLCEGGDEVCPDEMELPEIVGGNSSWEEGACPDGRRQICVNSSVAESTTTSTTTTSDTTLDTSMSTQADSSLFGENKTEIRVLCAFCPPGHYLSDVPGNDTTTSSPGNTTSTPVDTSSSSPETDSTTTTTTTEATSSSSDTTSMQTTVKQYWCLPCSPGVNDKACPVPSQTGPDNLKYIIIGAVLGGVVLIVVIVVVTVVCCRQGKCCCQGRRGTRPPVSLQNSGDGRNKDPENAEDDSRNNRRGRYTPMPGSQTGPHTSDREASEVDSLPMAPPPPKGMSKRLSVKIQQLRLKRSTKKRKEEPDDKKDGKEGAGYMTMSNLTASRIGSPSSDPIYQNQEEAIGSGNAADGEEIYQNDDPQEIYENQGVDEQEIYANEEVIHASGGQLPKPAAAVVDGQEVYYNVGDEDYENPDGRRK